MACASRHFVVQHTEARKAPCRPKLVVPADISCIWAGAQPTECHQTPALATGRLQIDIIAPGANYWGMLGQPTAPRVDRFAAIKEATLNTLPLLNFLVFGGFVFIERRDGIRIGN